MMTLATLATLGLALSTPAPADAANDPAAEARAAYAAQDGARLEKASRALLTASPRDPEVQLALGVALFWQDRPEEAIAPMRRRLALRDDADGHAWLGRALAAGGQFVAGEKELRTALALKPDSAVAQKWLATALAHQGRYREALEAVRAFASKSPDGPDTQELLGHLTPSAAWTFPSAALAHHGKGTWLLERRRWKDAVAEFGAALRLAPAFADCRYHVGWALEKLGDHAAAERHWRAAIAGYAPSEQVLRSDAQYQLGSSLGTFGGPDERKEGITLLRTALAAATPVQVAGFAFALGQICAPAGELDCARDAFIRFLSAPPAVSSRDFPLARARDDAQKALWNLGCEPDESDPPRYTTDRCPPLEATLRLQAGLNHLRAGRLAPASAELEGALKLAPGLAVARIALAQVLLAGDKYAQAEAALRAALDSTGVRASEESRTTTRQLLALALVRQGEKPVEAIRLALAARERSKDPAQLALLDVTLGWAFAQAGNARCAAQRLREVLATPGIADEVGARAQQGLAQLEAEAVESAGQCFEYEKYVEASLPSLAERLLASGGDAYGPGKFQLVPIEFYRVRVKALGGRRPLSEPSRFMTSEYAEHMFGDPNDRRMAVYRTEVKVSVGSTELWLPIQEQLLQPWADEVAPGSDVDLFLWFLGGMDRQLVFVAAEFAAIEPVGPAVPAARL